MTITASLRPALTLDRPAGKLRDGSGAPVPLTSAQYQLVEMLADAAGQIVSYADLCAAALGRPLRTDLDYRCVIALADCVRRRLPRDRDGDPVLRNVRGQGYWLLPGTVAVAGGAP